MRATRHEQIMLGYSDGAVGPEGTDPFTSRLGGQPQWLDDSSPIPEPATGTCDQCQTQMALLAQAYAPLDGSPYERVLYVWACTRRACTGKPGAAKAVRAHLLNADYALKLAKQSKAAARPKPASAFGSGLFGSGSTTGAGKLDFGSVWRTGSDAAPSSEQTSSLFTGPLFGSAKAEDTEPSDIRDGDKDGSKDAAIDELAAELGKVAVSDNAPRIEWPPNPDSAEIDQALELAADASCRAGKGKGKQASSGEPDWSEERYEHAMLPKGTDAAFARFARTVEQNPEQVMRYQFAGTPLPYTLQDETARVLGFSSASDDDDDDDDDGQMAPPDGCSGAGLPRCPHCGGPRVFECQLMPALLTVLELPVSVEPRASPAARLVGSELMRAFDLGLEFGTMLVYVCAADCHGGKTGTEYLGRSTASMRAYAAPAYYEEPVLVQLEAFTD
ncbi:hypothetical protein LPJ63_002542 [Coemansia sp. RSA 2711]|nr:hypothetical protein LPJ63_002542 [Coemansia sp. RSA 2711]